MLEVYSGNQPPEWCWMLISTFSESWCQGNLPILCNSGWIWPPSSGVGSMFTSTTLSVQLPPACSPIIRCLPWMSFPYSLRILDSAECGLETRGGSGTQVWTLRLPYKGIPTSSPSVTVAVNAVLQSLTNYWLWKAKMESVSQIFLACSNCCWSLNPDGFLRFCEQKIVVSLCLEAGSWQHGLQGIYSLVISSVSFKPSFFFFSFVSSLLVSG